MKGPHFIFSFESDVISLDIPPEGVVVSDVWRIEPLTPLLVSIHVDNAYSFGLPAPCAKLICMYMCT